MSMYLSCCLPRVSSSNTSPVKRFEQIQNPCGHSWNVLHGTVILAQGAYRSVEHFTNFLVPQNPGKWCVKYQQFTCHCHLVHPTWDCWHFWQRGWLWFWLYLLSNNYLRRSPRMRRCHRGFVDWHTFIECRHHFIVSMVVWKHRWDRVTLLKISWRIADDAATSAMKVDIELSSKSIRKWQIRTSINNIIFKLFILLFCSFQNIKVVDITTCSGLVMGLICRRFWNKIFVVLICD